MDRFARQGNLVPRRAIEQCAATVIGVGAVGRQVALQLAAIGIPRMTIQDFDTVEETNVVTQGYRMTDIGVAKVLALQPALQAINPDIVVDARCYQFLPGEHVEDAVFCAVDSIETRARIWQALEAGATDYARGWKFWSDTRMMGETIRSLTATRDNDSSRKAYSKTLFTAAEAQQGQCTGRSTIYAANLAASLAVHQFTRWLRGFPLDNDLLFNLLSSELTLDPEGIAAEPA